MKLFKRLPHISIIFTLSILTTVLWSAVGARGIAHADDTSGGPIPVKIGIIVEDLVEVDKMQESFQVVGSLHMKWTDPKLAYSIESCQCDEKVFSDDEFNQFLIDYDEMWPYFSFHNQYGERFIQNRVVAIYPDGSAQYFERFTGDFLADFNFRRFPFDSQKFTILVDLMYPQDMYIFQEMDGFSRLNDEYGEEEINLTGFSTGVSSQLTSAGYTSSRFKVEFEGPRHLEYYIFRIFLPILGILLISWFAFFLKDFHKRMDVELADVVLYITFSFSLQDNYPRLGYPTLLDAIMSIALLSNILVVLICVLLKLLEDKGQRKRAERIDRVLTIAYPIGLVLLFVLSKWLFFR